MEFSLKSTDFSNAVNRIRSVVSNAMGSSDPILKDWGQNLLRVDYVFSNESIEQLENNLLETKKWNLFNLVYTCSNNSNNDLELMKVTTIIIFIYFQEAYFRLGTYSEDTVFNKFKDKVYDLKNEEYQKYKTYFDYMDELPYRICKEIYSDTRLNEIRKFLEEKDFSDYRELIKESEKASDLISGWNSTLEVKTNEINKLEKKLENYKTTYDFVLLNEGFKNLYDQKKEDLKNPESNYKWLFRFILAIPVLEIIFFGWLIANQIEINTVAIWYMVVPSISLILFLFYFYRINLQEIRSIKSQMMQLELRMALCQFIHNYAEDSENLHKKNTAGFEKFENIIFSPLVSSDDKIPTTFDGIEQLANLVSQFRNK